MKNNIFRIPDKLLKKNEGGVYLAYCEYSKHRGIIKKDYKCEKRNCFYYRKFYLNGKQEREGKLEVFISEAGIITDQDRGIIEGEWDK